eukprot:gnl/MRDRNA2_/MRDRNA2_97882_c0_seq1.p1 gnl/MRDRNA2_/MRDRNA2_97882_c0~~gnl/MRDRNA2_/MRDRNA2_97882_c0_seq1.p1  ORF type:complete len:165 (+),score=13.23 gnl/MRDRNA2_/MRDRNA2_97882_c0_seq1:115-609(+)
MAMSARGSHELQTNPLQAMVRDYWQPFRMTWRSEAKAANDGMPEVLRSARPQRRFHGDIRESERSGLANAGRVAMGLNTTIEREKGAPDLPDLARMCKHRDRVGHFFAMPQTARERSTTYRNDLLPEIPSLVAECKKVDRAHHFQQSEMITQARETVKFHHMMR